MADTPVLTGLFPDRESAERAYEGVVNRGYSRDDVNVVMSDETRARHFGPAGGSPSDLHRPDGATEHTSGSVAGRETELGSKAAEGAGIGAGIGGTLGAIAAAVAAIGTSLVLPGLGLVVAGPLAAALAGAGAGGAAGSLVGALIGWGIPEERVKEYESGLRNGGILMGVRPRNDDDAAFIGNHWRDARGEAVHN